MSEPRQKFPEEEESLTEEEVDQLLSSDEPETEEPETEEPETEEPETEEPETEEPETEEPKKPKAPVFPSPPRGTKMIPGKTLRDLRR